MTITESLYKEIDSGREGHLQGYSMGMPKLESIIDGITKRTLYVVGAPSGVGKTSFVLHSFIYRALIEHIDDDNFKILFFSLEMNGIMIFAKLLSTYIFETYGKKLSVKKILSRQKGYILDDESYELIKKSKDWMNKVESKLEVYDKSLNADKLYAIVMKRLETLGSFSESENRKVFTPYNSDLIYEIVIDHIGLLKPTSGSKKAEIDKTVSYLITLRNMCDLAVVIVQQINRQQGDVERFKLGRTAITLNDFKESADTTDGAEIVLAAYNPNRDKLNSYRGYDIKKLGNFFRMISVLKSRYGDSDYEIGVNYHGAENIWKEMPLPNDIYDYEKYLTPDYILKEDNETKEDNSNLTFDITL